MTFRYPTLLLVLMVLAAPALRAQGTFSVHVDPRVVTLGHALTLRIQARDPGQSLSALKLDALRQDFHIDSVSTSVSRRHHGGRLRITRSVSVTLYPLHSGTLRIPPLRFMGHTSRPVQVSVRQTAPGAPRVHFRAWITPAEPLVRQVTTLHLTIRDEGSVQWQPIRLPSISGLYLRRIRATQRQQTVDGVQQTVRRYVWELLPLQAGDWTVRFPMLSAVSFGNPLQYPVPPLHFHADPVPAYLPVYVPIGKVSVQRQRVPTRLKVGRAVNWTLTVTRETRAGGDAHTVQRWQVTIPLRPLQAGTLTLPDISLAYFDPKTGRIAAATAGGQHLAVIDPGALRLRRGLYAVAALILLGLAGYGGRAWYRRFARRRAALARVRQAGDLQSLRHAVMGFAVHDSGPPPTTLGQWARAVGAANDGGSPLAELARELDAVQFHRQDPVSPRVFSELKSRIMEALRSRKAAGG